MAHDRTGTKVDLLGQLVELTGKVMPNGEVRRRVRFGAVSANLTTSRVGGWQDGHLHRGLTETYVAFQGHIAIVCESTARTVRMLMPGESLSVVPWEAHNVYVYPGAEFGVFVYGVPVGNPDKKNNDWWPASRFDAWSKTLDEAAIKRFAD